MLGLLGEPADEAAAARAHGDGASRPRWRKASLTRVERRDPYKLAPQDGPRASSTDADAGVRLGRLPRGAAASPECRTTSTSTEPEFFKALNAADREPSAGRLEDVPALARRAMRARPICRKPFVDENFEFYRKTLRGVKEQPPRWKRCVRLVDRDLGEALGQEFVRGRSRPRRRRRRSR